MNARKKLIPELLPWLALFACAGISIFSLLPISNQNVKYLGIFLSGIIPLGFYHFSLHQQRIDETKIIRLTEAEIDSIYYFGFVITLITLIAAVFTLGTIGSKSFNPETIGIQFGLGLFVTGYALIARLHLQIGNESDIEPEDAYANYLDRVNSLLGRVDRAYSDLDELLQNVVTRIRTTMEAEASENSARLGRQVEDSFAPLLLACKQLALEIGDQGLSNQMESMRGVIGTTNRTFKTLETRLQVLTGQVEKSSAPLEKLAAAFAECEQGSAAFASVLNSLKVDSNLTTSISSSVETISKALRSFAISMNKIEDDFDQNAGKSSSAFQEFNGNLVASTNSLLQSMIQLAGAMATSSDTLRKSIQEATSDAPKG